MKVFISFLMYFCLLHVASSQTNSISGTITDSASGEPLFGANIRIEELSKGASTNPDGRFIIQALPTGSYQLEISYIGFESVTEQVEIVDGQSARLDLKLMAGSLSLGDIEVNQSPVQLASTLSALDIALRPVKTSQDILKIVPGLFIAQHAGGGKAEQIFLRGFDIDHGTDIALTVDGMPVNMVSHAHGQGYSDLHFVIPETIERVAFDKGPYYASKGNLNTAGYADFKLKKRLNANLLQLEGGQFGYWRGLGMFNLLKKEKDSSPSLYLATEQVVSDGYFESSQNLRRFNGLLKYHHLLSQNHTLELSASAFHSQWTASGQVPQRAIERGLISRFGAIDATEGGETNRFNLNLQLTSELNNGAFLKNQVWFSQYDFHLVSNFTFFLNDPVNGDQITQSEERTLFGSQHSYLQEHSLLDLRASLELGAGFRQDFVNDIRLSRTLNRTSVLEDLSRGNVAENNLFLYAEEQIDLSERLLLTGGLHYDYFTFNHEDRLSGISSTENKGIVSPKLQLSYQATDKLSLYTKTGIGFHSNDARVVVAQQGRQILPKGFGVDIGTYWKPSENLFVNLALWQLDLEQEFIYVGDEGIVEAGGRTHRAGIDLNLRYQLNSRLYADMDLNLTKARLTQASEGANYIPLAPNFTSIGGLNFEGKKGLTGSLRYRFLGDRAANEDNTLTASGYFLIDARLNYRIGTFDFGLSIENLLNREWKEAQFETESKLLNEVESVSEIHFTPGTPFQARFSVGLRF
ncbi:MAG: TonB-dependent receptor [Roseivirga sp.]|nr:TonB-dependent receptor [Roseivirga sp.]